MGATAIDSPIGVKVFLLFFFVAFSPNLGDWVCVFGACVLFSGIFGALVCVWNVLFFAQVILIIREFIFYIHL